MTTMEVARKLKLDFPKGSAIFSNLRPTSTDQQVYDTADSLRKVYGEQLEGIILTIETSLIQE